MALAFHQNVPVAGAVFLHFGKKAIFKYGASIQSYHYLRPNNLLMWQAIKKYLREGCRYFNFGRTEPQNKGLLQFKRGWGARERMIYYYNYDLTKDMFTKRENALRSSYGLFKILPVPLLKIIGRILYRHVG